MCLSGVVWIVLAICFLGCILPVLFLFNKNVSGVNIGNVASDFCGVRSSTP